MDALQSAGGMPTPSQLVFSARLSNPRVVLPLNALLCATALTFALSAHALRNALLALAGVLTWTFLEYAIHRWLMHRTGTPWQRWIWLHLHKDHHQQVTLEDPAHRCTSALLSLPLFTAAFAASGPALGLVAGVALGFTLYEWVHFAEHDPRLSRRLRRFGWFRERLAHHGSHHSRALDRNFGFLSSFWDRLLGTYRSA